jgi:hypothetical protein
VSIRSALRRVTAPVRGLRKTPEQRAAEYAERHPACGLRPNGRASGRDYCDLGR